MLLTLVVAASRLAAAKHLADSAAIAAVLQNLPVAAKLQLVVALLNPLVAAKLLVGLAETAVVRLNLPVAAKPQLVVALLSRLAVAKLLPADAARSTADCWLDCSATAD